MSVQKYRSVEEMPRPPLDSSVPLHLRIAAAWERAHLHGPPMLPRGVQKYRVLPPWPPKKLGGGASHSG